ncbi:hypothetical protein GCM10012275_30330 [Longimycelium tulufanense]|uniref:Rrf2 family transcriptional regulator n=1 Tax=Longimycelium tulufanense TaxID=907463 RepID=A0A8J3CFA5_9PSEU|nr:Rrf2 family transcriptional regulator [Longimycelium tulufanense]GGM57114.1 hypothetical protein GCM10012275_30330 [Longimycelium tulufanense]
MPDLRFPTLLDLMMLLATAYRDGRPMRSSSELAEALDINPVLVRRITAPLIRAGLITSIHGRRGGLQLTTPPEHITLRDIHVAAVGDKPMWDRRGADCQSHLNAGRGRAFFAQLNRQAEDAVLGVLDSYTLAACRDIVLGHGGQAESPRQVPDDLSQRSARGRRA